MMILKKSQKLKIKELMINLIVFMLVIILCIIFFEIILRAFYPMSLEHTKFNANLYYENIPNWKGYLRNPQFLRTEFLTKIQFNSFGLNNDEIDVTSLNEKYVVLIVGDSFVFGEGVTRNDSFPSVVKNLLKKDFNNIEIINAGTRSYDLGAYLNYIKYRSQSFQPDLIIVGVFVGNDLSGTSLYKYENNQLIETPLKNPDFMMCVRRFALRNSHAYAFTLSAIANNFIGDFLKKIGVFGNETSLMLNRETFHDNINITEELIKAIKQETDRNNQDILFISIPLKEQVYEEYYELLYHNNSLIGRYEYQDYLNIIMNNHNILHIDLLPQFIVEGHNNSLYYNLDGHLTKKGYYLVGNLTANKIKELLNKTDE